MSVIDNTDTEDMHSFVVPYTSSLKTPTDTNIPMTAENRFELNKEKVEEVDARHRIIPSPYRTFIADDSAPFDITGLSIENIDLLGVRLIGVVDLMKKLGISGTGNHKVTLMLGSLPLDIIGPESYAMEITSGGTTITATESSGLFYGMMSLIGFLDVSIGTTMQLKEASIDDKPQFSYRGHQVDVARNFRSKAAILKTIDAMALWKVSKEFEHQLTVHCECVECRDGKHSF